MFSTHRYSTVFVLFSHSQQTNRHSGARLTQIENAMKFNKHQATQQILRVEFTLRKLQEEYSGQTELSLTKIITKHETAK